MKKITILTSCNLAWKCHEGAIGLFVECAPDSPLSRYYPDALNISALIKNTDAMRAQAAILANKIILNEPLFRDIPQLTLFHEVIATELNKAIRIIKLHHFLMEQNFRLCCFDAPSWLSDGLSRLCQLTASPIKVHVPHSLRSNKILKVYHRLFEQNFSLSAVTAVCFDFVKKLDAFNRRSLLFNAFNNIKFDKRQIWFYSTAITYTNVGLAYEKYFHQPFQFLVENAHTGGKPLRQLNRSFHSIYAFSNRQFIPTLREINEATQTLHSHIMHCTVDAEEKLAQTIFLESDWLKLFFARHLPQGLLFSSIANRWADVTEPAMVVVGNPAFEGYVLYQAKKRKIPSVLLQHGLLGGYYPYSHHPVDHYVVRGQYWHDLLSPDAKQRALIINAGSREQVAGRRGIMCAGRRDHDRYILFATTPVSYAGDMFVDTHIRELLLTIIQSLSRTSTKLIIRVHPLERVSRYIKLVNALLQEMDSPIVIEYSQGGDIDTLIAHAQAVVMYCSTMFLDCIQYAVPIIGFSWIDFGFMDNIKQYHLFHLAHTLADLDRLLNRAAIGELLPLTADSTCFLANPEDGEIEKEKLLALHEASP